jgi:hypothetical protein
MQIWGTTLDGRHITLVVNRDDDVQIGPHRADSTFIIKVPSGSAYYRSAELQVDNGSGVFVRLVRLSPA